MLLTLVVFGVGIIRSFFTPERTRAILAGKRESTGNVLASLLGVVTPFCSCSAVPLFIGFVTTGVPLGVTFSFLICGADDQRGGACTFVRTVRLAGRRDLRRDWTGHRDRCRMDYRALETGSDSLSRGSIRWNPARIQFQMVRSVGLTRTKMGCEAVRDIVGRVWLYVVAGIAVGAGIHGYVPENFMAHIMGKGAWWSVPLAVLIGVPMYSNAAGIIPVVQALLGKGCSAGHGTGLHDVGHRIVAAGDHHSSQGASAAVDRRFCRGGRRRDSSGRLFVQRAHVGANMGTDRKSRCSVVAYLAK